MSEETLTSTFTNLRKRFLHFATHFLHDEDEAHDALQDAFCRLWPRKDEINTEQEAQALTMATVRNLCIDKIRQRQQAPLVSLNPGRDRLPTDSLSERQDKEEQLRLVEQIIERRLSPIQQEIVRLREYEGKGYEEIARKLNMQETAVRMQLSRARKIIRTCYQKQKEK